MKFAKVPKKLGVPVYRGMTHDGLGKYLKEKITKAPGETADIVKILKDTHTDVVVSYLPVGSEHATKWYVEQVLEAGCGFVNCIPVFIAREDYWDKRFKKARPADRRRRHQVAGRRDDRAPHARAPVRRPRREDAAHLAAERRRQHGLLQHARARAPGVQEDLQDQRRHLDHGRQAAGRRRLHRPVGLRAVADRPQVGAHPRRGPGLRRRAAERRAEARGVGLAELGRHRDRRRALLQARAQPRRRRPARRAVLVPDEVAAQPAPRRPGAPGHREVHRPDEQARADTESFIAEYASMRARARNAPAPAGRPRAARRRRRLRSEPAPPVARPSSRPPILRACPRPASR